MLNAPADPYAELGELGAERWGEPDSDAFDGSDVDPDDPAGPLLLHRAAIPNRCAGCKRDIAAGDLQSVAAGRVVCSSCARAE